MADNKVTTVFTANTQEFQAAIRQVVSDMGKVAKKTQEVVTVANKNFAGIGDGLKSAFNVLAGAAVFGKIYSAVKDDTQATAKLNAVLKSTGEIAGVTQGNIGGIIKELHTYTGESDATLKNTAAVMLTFKNINKDVFPDTMKATADLAAVMGVDLKSAAVQVGKAMNDPATGMTALVRSGVTFTDQQQKQIKHFTETNQLGKAQAIILKELQSQFGGAAQAMNNTPIGMIETAFNQLTNALAKIGAVIMPVIGGIIGFIGDFITSILNAGPAVKALAAAIAVAVGALMGPIGLAVGLIAAIGLLGSTVKSASELSSEIKQTKSSFSDLAKQDKLLASLKNVKAGSQQYITTAKQIEALNPKLKDSNLSAAKSFNDMSKAVNNASKEQQTYLRGIASLQVVETGDAINKTLWKIMSQGKATSAQQQELISLYNSLAQAAVLSGGEVNAQYARFQRHLGILQDGGALAAGTVQTLVKSFNDGRAAAKGLTTEVKTMQAAITAPSGDGAGAIKPDTLMADFDKLLGTLSSQQQKMNDVMEQGAAVRASIIQTGQIYIGDLEKNFNQQSIATMMQFNGVEATSQMLHMVEMLNKRGLYEDALALLAKSGGEAQIKQRQANAKKEQEIELAKQKAILDATAGFFGDMASIAQAGGKRFFLFYQAMAIGQATISGFEAATAAWAKGMQMGGPPLAALFTGVSIAKTAVQIAAIAKQKPAKMEFGGIIPPSAQGTILAGEKNKAEAIIPLEGEGASRLRAAGIGGASVYVDMKGANLYGEQIPEKVAEGIDRALYRLGLSGNSLVMQGA